MSRSHSTTTLESGVRVVTERTPGVRSVAVGYWIPTGSSSEPVAEAGTSHLLEHMLFRGTARYGSEEIDQILRWMKRIGHDRPVREPDRCANVAVDLGDEYRRRWRCRAVDGRQSFEPPRVGGGGEAQGHRRARGELGMSQVGLFSVVPRVSLNSKSMTPAWLAEALN